MNNLENKTITVNFAKHQISGEVSGTIDNWHFKSTDPNFLIEVPLGNLSSTSISDTNTSPYELEVCNSVQEIVKSLLST